MKFKNVREKIEFINKLEMMNSQSVKDNINIISLLAHDKNTDVRVALANQLVIFDSDEVESVLYDMLSDQNRMVRLETVDSLSIGRHEETIIKVGNMLEREGSLTRMYVVLTLFDLIINAYGMNDNSFGKYKQIVEKSFRSEKNPRVLLSYYQNEYYMHPEKGLSQIKCIYVNALENEEYDLIWTVLHVFKEIKNKKNYKEIQQIIEYKEEKLLPIQKVFVDDMQAEKMPYKILVLDMDNTFLSHVLALMLSSKCSKEDIVINTAGIDAGIVRSEDIRLFCERNHIFQPEELYSKRVTGAYVYDYIICLNTVLNQDMYSKTKTFYYTDIDDTDDDCLISLCEEIKVQLLG